MDLAYFDNFIVF